MTLVIAATTADGVVLTADSRQTYINRSGLPRIGSDNATKIIQLTEAAVVATAGSAFFWDSGKLKAIQSYLEEFRDLGALKDLKTTLDIAIALKKDCETWLERIMKATITQNVETEKGTGLVFQAIANAKLPYEYKDSVGQLQKKEWFMAQVCFLVAGRDPDGTCHSINTLPFMDIGVHGISESPTLQWIGQSEVVAKLLTGTDPFVISVATMTIQDTIDLATLLTRTTEEVQKFSDGTVGSQGGVPGVGGPIDVVVIPTKKGELQWLNRKTLHTD